MAGRPPGAENKDKPFRDALRMEAAALENGEKSKHRRGSLRWNANKLLTAGDCQSIKEIADRLDGKVPQAVDSTVDQTVNIRAISWLTPEMELRMLRTARENNSSPTTSAPSAEEKR